MRPGPIPLTIRQIGTMHPDVVAECDGCGIRSDGMSDGWCVHCDVHLYANLPTPGAVTATVRRIECHDCTAQRQRSQGFGTGEIARLFDVPERLLGIDPASGPDFTVPPLPPAPEAADLAALADGYRRAAHSALAGMPATRRRLPRPSDPDEGV